MTITIDIPDELAGLIVPEGQEPARRALEDMAVEAYREHRVTGAQLRLLLGISSFHELDGLLQQRGIRLDYTVDDFRREGAPAAPLMGDRPREARTAKKAAADPDRRRR